MPTQPTCATVTVQMNGGSVSPSSARIIRALLVHEAVPSGTKTIPNGGEIVFSCFGAVSETDHGTHDAGMVRTSRPGAVSALSPQNRTLRRCCFYEDSGVDSSYSLLCGMVRARGSRVTGNRCEMLKFLCD